MEIGRSSSGIYHLRSAAAMAAEASRENDFSGGLDVLHSSLCPHVAHVLAYIWKTLADVIATMMSNMEIISGGSSPERSTRQAAQEVALSMQR